MFRTIFKWGKTAKKNAKRLLTTLIDICKG